MTIVEACESKTNTTPEFPMGWYSVERSIHLAVGEVKAIKAFDRELVLYRLLLLFYVFFPNLLYYKNCSSC